jgi:hypothetical protein
MYLTSPPVFYRGAIVKMISRLESTQGDSPENPHTRACIRALLIMRDIVDDLICHTRVARPFLVEFLDNLEKAQNPDVVPDYALVDYPLVKIECMACLLREYMQCATHERRPLPGVEEFLRYFEECGEWEKDDGKTVTRFYYYDIPEAYSHGTFRRDQKESELWAHS